MSVNSIRRWRKSSYALWHNYARTGGGVRSKNTPGQWVRVRLTASRQCVEMKDAGTKVSTAVALCTCVPCSKPSPQPVASLFSYVGLTVVFLEM